MSFGGKHFLKKIFILKSQIILQMHDKNSVLVLFFYMDTGKQNI